MRRRAAISERAYAPTVLLNPGGDCKVSTAEIFGPVVCVYAYDEMDDAIARANALPYSFQAAVFTRSIETALRATGRLDAATVMVNDHTAFRVDWMPFAGLRESGYGIGGIPYTFDDMQVEKLTVLRSAESPEGSDPCRAVARRLAGETRSGFEALESATSRAACGAEVRRATVR